MYFDSFLFKCTKRESLNLKSKEFPDCQLSDCMPSVNVMDVQVACVQLSQPDDRMGTTFWGVKC